MTNRKQKNLYIAACYLSVVCMLYQLAQVVLELPHMLGELQSHTADTWQIVSSACLAFAHIAVAVVLLVTAYGFWRHRANEHWLGFVALLKVLSFLLELLNYHDGAAGQITEVACCVLLGLYALCCFGVIHSAWLVPLETALLIIGYWSSLYVVVQHLVYTTHASLGAVLLAAVCDPLSTVVMLLLALGCHLPNE